MKNIFSIQKCTTDEHFWTVLTPQFWQ